jgi:CheY-like chemotaxis protein
MTGSALQQDVDRVTNSGFHSIIHKPFRINEVLCAISGALNLP